MSDCVIQVDGLSKKYILGRDRKARYATLRDALAHSAVNVGRRLVRALHASAPSDSDSKPEELWALRDVTFGVQQGERVGIIGRNGAGKSTLLKILSRITDPTRGRVTIRGRVASLLEVGTGFHPELTGRENIFLNGAVLGMTKGEIKRKFDEIVAFSEVEEFLDTPLKRYSSGMQVRLAFAVAAHLDPEILVVDEVLAVGDFAFQRKCLGKMQDVAQSGRTVLFVSHDMGAINTLCERALLLHAGSVVAAGGTREVVARYLEGAEKLYSPLRGPLQDQGEFRLLAVTAKQQGGPAQFIDCRQPFSIHIDYQIVRAVRNSRLFAVFRNAKGEIIFGTCDYDEPSEEALNRNAGRFLSSFTIPGGLLKTGPLYGTIGMDVRGERVVFAAPDVIQLDLFEPNADSHSERHVRDGAVAPLLLWRTTPLADLGACAPADSGEIGLPRRPTWCKSD
jgi:homopolymeric O-antigen transport system ATP-binding protein